MEEKTRLLCFVISHLPEVLLSLHVLVKGELGQRTRIYSSLNIADLPLSRNSFRRINAGKGCADSLYSVPHAEPFPSI
jgi:hypothetical protein